MKAIMPCVMKFTAGFVASEVASRYVVGPAIEGAIGGLTGNPVDLTTGRKVIPDETDFSLFREFERTLSQYVRTNGTVDVDIVFKYAEGASRPDRIIYNVLQDGELIMQGGFFN